MNTCHVLLVLTHCLAFLAGLGLYSIVRKVKCGDAP
jgi:hypothetical protein